MEVGTCHDGLCDSLATDIARHDMVWVIVNRLTKSTHFLAMRMRKFCRLYVREIVRLHEVLVYILLDRDPRFTTHFWESFQ